MQKQSLIRLRPSFSLCDVRFRAWFFLFKIEDCARKPCFLMSRCGHPMARANDTVNVWFDYVLLLAGGEVVSHEKIQTDC